MGHKQYKLYEKNAREHNFKCLINELIEAGFEIPGKENLKKKNKELEGCIQE